MDGELLTLGLGAAVFGAVAWFLLVKLPKQTDPASNALKVALLVALAAMVVHGFRFVFSGRATASLTRLGAWLGV